MIKFDIKEYNIDELEYLKKIMQHVFDVCIGCDPETSCFECKWYSLTDDAEIATCKIEKQIRKRKGENK